MVAAVVALIPTANRNHTFGHSPKLGHLLYERQAQLGSENFWFRALVCATVGEHGYQDTVMVQRSVQFINDSPSVTKVNNLCVYIQSDLSPNYHAK